LHGVLESLSTVPKDVEVHVPDQIIILDSRALCQERLLVMWKLVKLLRQSCNMFTVLA
jgi:hypothetical protein